MFIEMFLALLDLIANIIHNFINKHVVIVGKYVFISVIAEDASTVIISAVESVV